MECLKCNGEGEHWHIEGNPDNGIPDILYCDRCNGTGEVDYYTQQELTDKCTPEIIKKMVEFAEGFEIENNVVFFNDLPYADNMTKVKSSSFLFPLLIRRAVEGWNKITKSKFITIDIDRVMFSGLNYKIAEFKNYQPTTLTHAECAMLDCLIDIFKEESK